MDQEYKPCECGCTKNIVDVHHLDGRGMGGSDYKNYIENLAGVARDCHIKAEKDEEFNEKLRQKHLINVERKSIDYE